MKNKKNIENMENSIEESKKIDLRKEIFSWVMVFVIAWCVAFLLSRFIVINAKIPTESMDDTIEVGDKVFGFRLSYLFSDPKRGDIIMFDAPNKEDTIYIKRLIGLPGDTIKIKDNVLYINGEEYKEDYVDSWYNSIGEYEYTLGDDEYFMMGDNRDHSSDSRAWGPISKDAMIAKAIFKYKIIPFKLKNLY